jgi:hypothetical protein
VNNAIQDRVSEGGLGNHFKPDCHGELAGDQDGATAIAILDDLHEIAPMARGEAIRSPIVEHEEIGFDQDAEQPGKAAIAMGEFKIGKQSFRAFEAANA